MSGAADPRARMVRPQRGARRTARGRGPERGCDPLRQNRVGRSVGADRGGWAVEKGGSCISLGVDRGVVCAGCGVIPPFYGGSGRRWGVKDMREPPFSAPPRPDRAAPPAFGAGADRLTLGVGGGGRSPCVRGGIFDCASPDRDPRSSAFGAGSPPGPSRTRQRGRNRPSWGVLAREASRDGARVRSEGYGQSQWGFGAQSLGRVRPKGVWGRTHSGASAGRRW